MLHDRTDPACDEYDDTLQGDEDVPGHCVLCCDGWCME
jgi:hypothetical protein